MATSLQIKFAARRGWQYDPWSRDFEKCNYLVWRREPNSAWCWAANTDFTPRGTCITLTDALNAAEAQIRADKNERIRRAQTE